MPIFVIVLPSRVQFRKQLFGATLIWLQFGLLFNDSEEKGTETTPYADNKINRHKRHSDRADKFRQTSQREALDNKQSVPRDIATPHWLKKEKGNCSAAGRA